MFAATRRAFARCLAALGRWRPDTDVRPHALVLDAYRDHLNAVLGLSPPTVAQHISTVAAFLEETLSAGLAVSDLTREQVECHVVATGYLTGDRAGKSATGYALCGFPPREQRRPGGQQARHRPTLIHS